MKARKEAADKREAALNKGQEIVSAGTTPRRTPSRLGLDVWRGIFPNWGFALHHLSTTQRNQELYFFDQLQINYRSVTQGSARKTMVKVSHDIYACVVLILFTLRDTSDKDTAFYVHPKRGIIAPIQADDTRQPISDLRKPQRNQAPFFAKRQFLLKKKLHRLENRLVVLKIYDPSMYSDEEDGCVQCNNLIW
ncbi:hypothetical protein NQ317_006625 [Molorchus minor]|uniref:Uncharacterized protein n=1 Tax=Molorchus minor TaxID=1323400 RepID=A0ABQ9J174_9CUCU|nr:hypothetical protein NQ317_006625 [Molorchus minor]